jgi:hypothetical protein
MLWNKDGQRQSSKRNGRKTHNFATLTTGCLSPSLNASTEYPVLCQSMMILLPVRLEASWTTGRVGIAGGFCKEEKGEKQIRQKSNVKHTWRNKNAGEVSRRHTSARSKSTAPTTTLNGAKRRKSGLGRRLIQPSGVGRYTKVTSGFSASCFGGTEPVKRGCSVQKARNEQEKQKTHPCKPRYSSGTRSRQGSGHDRASSDSFRCLPGR